MSHLVLAAATAAPSTIPPLWRTLPKFAYYLGLVAAIGFAVTIRMVLWPVLEQAGTDPSDRSLLRRRAAVLLAITGSLLPIAAYFQLAAQVARKRDDMSYPAALAPDQLWNFLRLPAEPGEWISAGSIVLGQEVLTVALALLLVPLFARRLQARTGRLVTIAVPVALLITLVALIPTNVSGLTLDDELDEILTQVHIVGGSVWIGGLAVLVGLAAGRSRLTPAAGLVWAQVWQRFSVLALSAVGAVLVSGLWLTWKHVGNVQQLFTTTYGRFLLVKICLVLALIAAGAFNQLVLMPRIARARADDDQGSVFALTLRHFPGVVAVECLLGVGVLAIVPFLSGSARSQAGDDSGSPVATGTILFVGVVLVATLAASFVATAMASQARARTRIPA